MKTLDLDNSTVLIISGAIVAGVVLLKLSADIGKGAKDIATGAVDLTGGLVSGNNIITESARTNAYEGAGIFGTLGAAFDNASGGTFSKAGEWLGGKIYDWTH